MSDRPDVGHRDFADRPPPPATTAAVVPLSSSPTRYDPDAAILSSSASSSHSADYLRRGRTSHQQQQQQISTSSAGPYLTQPRQRGGTGSSSSSPNGPTADDRTDPSSNGTSAATSRRVSPVRSSRQPVPTPRRGSSGGASDRRPSGDDLRPPIPVRYNSADMFAPPVPPVASSSRHGSGADDNDDAGWAGRGAGPGGGRGMAPNVPTINTHMMMSPPGGTGPYAGPPSASASIGTYSAGGANDSRQSLLGGRRPPPLQIPTDDPEQIGAALQPRTPTHGLSPAFPTAGQGRGSPSHSYSLPMSQSNSTLSSHSHSHGHSHGHSHSPSLQYTTTAGRSPITAAFPRSTSTSSSSHHQAYAGTNVNASGSGSGTSPFMQPSSRPESAASHSHGHSHSQQLAHPASSQYQTQQYHSSQPPPVSPYARSPGGPGLPPSSDGGHSRMSESRSRGNSAASGELRDGAARDRERERDGVSKRERERDRDRDRARKEKDPRAGATGAGSSSRDGKANGSATPPALCAKCDLPMTGQFVRALGTVYHLDCFRCMDCNKVVAAKFFPIDAPDGSGRQVPLCETDYFRRLNLLCSKCGQALRGSYITALDMKFHVEHFTCSVCPTVFGPQDSYYEHAGSVYCHFHYSTRFAVKCTGCRTAILKQFVEINRNSIDEHWHPECYMIHKFWNIKLAPTPPPKPVEPTPEVAAGDSVEGHTEAEDDANEYLAVEAKETPASLKSRQKRMEEQVYRIWTILSAFEESSAACISEMLRHVSSGHYMEGVGMAEKFVLHVETLFAAIDDLNEAFRNAGAKEMQHVREARMLCKKIVNFFMLLSHTHETGARKMSITQDLLSLVTGLAHYLKILIRIALTGSLKLEREYDDRQAIGIFLSRLDRLARDPEANKISTTIIALARNGAPHSEPPSRQNSGQSAASGDDAPKASLGTSRPAYGYKSLARAVGTLIGQGEATTDLCEGCRLTVEEECARLGTSIRWHLPCLRCATCQKLASRDPSGEEISLTDFVWASDGTDTGRRTTYCRSCAPPASGALDGIRDGFEYVTRLEQYAFLLCVALNKLFGRLKQKGVVPVVQPTDEEHARGLTDIYGDSNDIKRMKSVQLDRKLSSTAAHVPKRSTVVQSPSGRTATSDATDPTFNLFQAKPPIPSRKDQPLIDPVSGMPVPRNQVREVLPSSQQATPTPSAGATPLATPGLPNGVSNPIANSSYAPPSPTSSPKRPPMDRRTTAVRIVDEPGAPELRVEPDGLGGQREPTQDEDGLTLADLPKALEAEQRRTAGPEHFMRPGANGGPFNSGPAGHALPPHSIGVPTSQLGSRLLSELSALESFIVKHVAAVLLSSDSSPLREVVTLDELLDIIDARKNTFWGKLFKPGGGEKKKVPKKGVFGIPLEVLVERNGADSMHGAGPGSLRIPSFVDDVVSAMKQMDMSIEGIFRKNGNIRRLKELTEALDRDASSVNLSDDNPVQLAALLKKFLRDLPDPLMCFKLFHLWIAAQRIEDAAERSRIRHYICCLMPKAHRDTMEALFVFLKWVASFSHVDEETGSKMDLQNLATVISPNILYAKGKDPVRDESFLAARVVHELLERQDEYWEVPVECLSILNDQELLSNPAQLTTKEILLRAESHIRSAGAAGQMRVSRGHTGAPRRPGLQEAWSAPHLTGSGRPLSTSVTPSRFRSPERDPRAQALPGHPPFAGLASSRTASPYQGGGLTIGIHDNGGRRGGFEGTSPQTPLNERAPVIPHPYQQVPREQ